jgi:hypothetical protein
MQGLFPKPTGEGFLVKDLVPLILIVMSSISKKCIKKN